MILVRVKTEVEHRMDWVKRIIPCKTGMDCGSSQRSARRKSLLRLAEWVTTRKQTLTRSLTPIAREEDGGQSLQASMTMGSTHLESSPFSSSELLVFQQICQVSPTPAITYSQVSSRVSYFMSKAQAVHKFLVELERWTNEWNLGNSSWSWQRGRARCIKRKKGTFGHQHQTTPRV